jgi:hypothetical protein
VGGRGKPPPGPHVTDMPRHAAHSPSYIGVPRSFTTAWLPALLHQGSFFEQHRSRQRRQIEILLILR